MPLYYDNKGWAWLAFTSLYMWNKPKKGFIGHVDFSVSTEGTNVVEFWQL